MRFLNIGLVFLLVLEVMSIIWMADWIGGGWTFILMIFSMMMGGFFLRRLGLSAVFLAVSAARNGGELSTYQMMWPLRYTFACLLLMSPGFISSILALILMLPLKGGNVVGQNTQHFGQSFQHRHFSDDDVIDGEFTVDESNRSHKETKHLPK